jgi:hypothetical protein
MPTPLLASLAIAVSTVVAAGEQASTTVLPEPVRAHIEQDRFELVTSIRGLPLGVRGGLQALFRSDFLDIAEPGAPFRSTNEATDRSLPTRRLVHAACSSDHCVIYYERGGTSRTWHVAIFHWIPAATRFESGGIAPGGLRTIAEVRNAILSDRLKTSTSW